MYRGPIVPLPRRSAEIGVGLDWIVRLSRELLTRVIFAQSESNLAHHSAVVKVRFCAAARNLFRFRFFGGKGYYTKNRPAMSNSRPGPAGQTKSDACASEGTKHNQFTADCSCCVVCPGRYPPVVCSLDNG